MKKIVFTFLFFLTVFAVQAKKVKFATDMTGQVVSPNGMHVTGDFQTIAGFPGGDWAANTTPLTQEGSTNIYSIVVDLPAFAKYEYKFVNGDQFYEAEFVPLESRVGYNFDDNRWIYVDSLGNDTSFVGAIIFAGNAPANLTLVRFIVNMYNYIVPVSGVHVAGDFQNWDPSKTILYSFGSNVYEVISYVTAGTYAYKFYNGNLAGTVENVPLACATNNNREIVVSGDIVLPEVCFNACVSCSLTGINTIGNQSLSVLTPNPANTFSKVLFADQRDLHQVFITDVTGKHVRSYVNINGPALEIKRENMEAGIYFVHVVSDENTSSFYKLIFE